MTTYESFFSHQGSQIRGGNCVKIVQEGVELPVLDPLRQESRILTSNTQVFDFSGTRQACSTYVYVNTLWFSETATVTKKNSSVISFLFFQATYQKLSSLNNSSLFWQVT